MESSESLRPWNRSMKIVLKHMRRVCVCMCVCMVCGLRLCMRKMNVVHIYLQLPGLSSFHLCADKLYSTNKIVCYLRSIWFSLHSLFSTFIFVLSLLFFTVISAGFFPPYLPFDCLWCVFVPEIKIITYALTQWFILKHYIVQKRIN